MSFRKWQGLDVSIYESDLEEACLLWFAQLGYEVLESDNFDPATVYDERASHETVVLEGRLRIALEAINEDVPPQAVDEAIRRLKRRDAPTLEQNNLDFHRMLTDGVTVELASPEGGVRGHLVRLFDFDDPERNDWLVGNQVAIVDRVSGTGQPRRPDVIVWVNGLPLAVLELKNPGAERADVWSAYNQIQTYKKDIPSLFATNELVVISDDVLSRIGSLTADRARFQPWRAVHDEDDLRVPAERDERLDHGERLQALVEGVFHKERLLDLVRSFVTFERQEGRIVKKLAGYHQFHAVRRAVEATVVAAGPKGDRRVGVVWHTQGSGKSLTMVFYGGKLVVHPVLQNPTLVVVTDRNDLDDQLFGTFAQSEALLRQTPVQAKDREHLRKLLKTASGGVYFTTMQKFVPVEGERADAISERRNIIVMADEAHRSQYGLSGKLDAKTGRMKYGFALHLRDALPNASFVGFTGTPVELEDKSTIEVFGDHISVYDIQRAVDDGATVPIYYESRQAKIQLDEAHKPHIDADFEEITEDEEDEVKQGLMSEWASVEALVGAPSRLRQVAKDLVEHFERRNQAMDGGKAMVVCMSRRICAALYEEIERLRPEWHEDDPDLGKVKVVMTGSASDVPELRKHLRSKGAREALASRFKDPEDQLSLVIVRDMWLTGFDAPCMHTLYVDKPMRGHNLMQAIARVNRVYGDKPGGLVVDYLGVAGFLKQAMHTYTARGGKGNATELMERAVELMQEKLEVCRELFHGFDYSAFFRGNAQQRLDLMPAARQFILAKRREKPKGKDDQQSDYDRFLRIVAELSLAAARCGATREFDELRDEIAFFQAVKAGLVKLSPGRKKPIADLSHAVRQIVANAVVSDQVVDVFDAAGLEKPDVSILSEEFLAEVQGMRHRDLAAAALERILRDKIRERSQSSVAQGRSFEQMLEEAVNRYINRSIETVELIQRLIEIAREMREAGRKGEELGLTSDEFAFYEALAANESAREVLKDDVLSKMAHELTATVRSKASIDWNKRQAVQAELRLAVKKLLKKYGYPPDAAALAIETVLEQAKRLGINLTEGASSDEPESIPPESGEAPRHDLPHPIAVFDAILRSQEEATHRVKTQLDAIERAFTFVVVCELGWLRARGGQDAREKAEALVRTTGGKRVSMGAWLELVWQLAALLPSDDDHPVVRCARNFVTDKGKPSDLTKTFQQAVVPLRNSKTHGVTIAEEQLHQHEVPLREQWTALKAALGPLRELQLISRAKLKDFDEDGSGAEYNVRLLTGPSEHFLIVAMRLTGKLEEHWAYLMGAPGERPISLAPMLRLRVNQDSGRREVMAPRTLVLAKGAKIELCQLVGSDTEKIVVG
jgi:type I restriction enzyme R subunit